MGNLGERKLSLVTRQASMFTEPWFLPAASQASFKLTIVQSVR